MEAATFVQTIEQRQGIKISAPRRSPTSTAGSPRRNCWKAPPATAEPLRSAPEECGRRQAAVLIGAGELSMKILITGCRGQLGTELQSQLAEEAVPSAPCPSGCARPPLSPWMWMNWTSPTAKPPSTISAATSPRRSSTARPSPMWTAARPPAMRPSRSTPWPRNLALACEKINARLIHVSTDYVFPGAANGGIALDECAVPAPISAYGQTKLLGEQYVERFCRRHFHRAHRLALQLLWKKLRQNHGPSGSRPTIRSPLSTTSWATPPTPVDLAYHIFEAGRQPRLRHLPLHRQRHLQLV